MENQFTNREEIIEIANKLFVYTDSRQWKMLMNEVFTESVVFDMASAGAGEAVTMSAQEICDTWDRGFKGIDAIHHQAGNYLVSMKDEKATVLAYAIALHYKKSATMGHTREFVGSYELEYIRMPGKGWRICAFHYYLKYINGNVELI